MLYELTRLEYSNNRTGPFRLYLYGPDGFHSGGQWFSATPKYPDEEITTGEAMRRALANITQGNEVRITDSGDFLIFHAKDKKILYPSAEAAETFWGEIGAGIGWR